LLAPKCRVGAVLWIDLHSIPSFYKKKIFPHTLVPVSPEPCSFLLAFDFDYIIFTSQQKQK